MSEPTKDPFVIQQRLIVGVTKPRIYWSALDSMWRVEIRTSRYMLHRRPFQDWHDALQFALDPKGSFFMTNYGGRP
ncbi:hypothetical protein HD598_002149 [Neomicrococcus aestuarii]|uniref:Uncharacterized protein n=1 Tax=Neomicrococcus aestuarii TaxID=556325 RepID=A0A7W8TV44_9MICC|nr:hypothetical protein [Neomicrococcus aestuarii]